MTLEGMLTALFWVSIGMVFYTYLVYPAVLFVLAAFRQLVSDARFALTRAERRPRDLPASLPSVSLIFSAYNEEAVIAKKMINCATLDYPAGRIEILVGCDGCSDQTAELARSANVPNARVFEFEDRSGKLGVLNRLVDVATSEIIVFSDASTFLDSASVRSLARHFSDPTVGCVCGELKLVPANGAARREAVYWRYEVFLKFLESRLGLLLGANGGVFAIRRELYKPLPQQAIIDDFIIAMNVRAAGRRLVYDPEAFAHEEAAPAVKDEFRRRVRIGAGNYHALRFTGALLNPFRTRAAFSYWSHKVCRWLVPFAIPAWLMAACLLSRSPFYMVSAFVGLTGLAGAFLGFKLDSRGRSPGILGLPYYFLSMNLALLLGFFRFAMNRQTPAWQRTARQDELAGGLQAAPAAGVTARKAVGGRV